MSNIHVDIGVSRYLRLLLGFMHVLALLALLLTFSFGPILVMGCSLLGASALWYDWRLRHPQLTVIEAGQQGYRVFWRGDWHPVELREALITVPLTIIHFQLAQQRIDTLLLPDAVDDDSYRRLRVWLRWSRQDKSGVDRQEGF